MKNYVDLKKQLLNDPDVQKEYDMLDVEFALVREIVKRRIEQGLTQSDLAMRVGTKQSAISRLESGTYNPSILFLQKVAHALGTELQLSFR